TARTRSERAAQGSTRDDRHGDRRRHASRSDPHSAAEAALGGSRSPWGGDRPRTARARRVQRRAERTDLMARLTAAARKRIPRKDFAVPSKAPGSGSYPIPDKSHARNALARASGKPVAAQVRAKVHRKYPD